MMKHLFTRFPKLSLFAGAAIVVIGLSAAYSHHNKPMPYHSQEETLKMMMSVTGLPVGDNGYFVGSGKCAGCHGIDPVGTANLTAEGEQVSPAENWRGSIMANSAKDPFWRAKVAHEIHVNPGHESELVNVCTRCHAPAGKYTHLMMGEEDYTMEMLDADSIARDGVNCGACHQQRVDQIGQDFSGILHFHTDTIWGPYVSQELSFPIFEAAMTSFVGYTPVGDHKFSKSESCAGCHTLQTHTADLEGNPTGNIFTEQATYHEWLNSSYNMNESLQKECQGCHMPRLQEPIVIASGYAFLPGREPYGQHWFVGGNSFMLNILKNNADIIGATAEPEHFNQAIDRTINQLQNETATVEILPGEVDGDTARYTLRITNLVGHKLPSGYPARRAYVEFMMTDDEGNTIFHSGRPDPSQPYEVAGNDLPYEPHWDLINDQDQVQIYEMIMGDVNGNPTTVLERANSSLKDNRLVPLGFSVFHSAYDTTTIAGGAETDPNFNHIGGVEGTGTDDIRFHIPVSGVSGNFTVTARLWYQSIPPRWTEEIFAIDDPVINAFETMYWEQGPTPVQVASVETNTVLTGISDWESQFSVGPNPNTSGQLNINGGKSMVKTVSIYTISGQLIETRQINTIRTQITLPKAMGTYIIDVHTADGQRHIEKVVRR
ncbi:MAG: T9SS type A sorting domain-containing protein [Flavobacteriales bacterium]|jgi:mono/diheme cytochrome c family protein